MRRFISVVFAAFVASSCSGSSIAPSPPVPDPKPEPQPAVFSLKTLSVRPENGATLLYDTGNDVEIRVAYTMANPVEGQVYFRSCLSVDGATLVGACGTGGSIGLRDGLVGEKTIRSPWLTWSDRLKGINQTNYIVNRMELWKYKGSEPNPGGGTTVYYEFAEVIVEEVYPRVWRWVMP